LIQKHVHLTISSDPETLFDEDISISLFLESLFPVDVDALSVSELYPGRHSPRALLKITDLSVLHFFFFFQHPTPFLFTPTPTTSPWAMRV